jgi:hypothetical protein
VAPEKSGYNFVDLPNKKTQRYQPPRNPKQGLSQQSRPLVDSNTDKVLATWAMCPEATIIIGQDPVSAWQVRCIVRCILRRRLRVTSKYIIEDATCFRQEFSRCKELRFHCARWKERRKIRGVSAIEPAFRQNAPRVNHNLHTS